jgi:site-specific DNA-methyltransferase (adenine-specific)
MIKINCSGNINIALEDLSEFQGSLKELPLINQNRLKASILNNGFSFPFGIWQNDGLNKIIDGHQRLKMLQALKNDGEDLPDKFPCYLVRAKTQAQAKELLLQFNSNYGKITEAGLDIFIEDIELDRTTIDKTMDLQIDDIEIAEPQEEAEEDDYDESETEETTVKLGDVYQLGAHRMICGDATIDADIAKLMGDVKADMYLTDPPYNVDYTGGTKEKMKIKGDKMSDEAFRQFLTDSFQVANDHMKKGGVFYIWHADSERYNFQGACRDVDWQVRQCLIWNKNSMVMGRQDYHWKHEPCLYGWKGGASHLWATDRKQVTILNFDRPTRNGEHPTMKPIKLMSYQILNNTKGEDVVLDTFGGSGSTLIACEQIGRICYTVELDPHYCQVIIDRWEKLTGKKAVKL